MREARFDFVQSGQAFPGSLVDCSNKGLCVRFPGGVPLSVGQSTDLLVGGIALQAFVRWVIVCGDPPSTTVGIEVAGGLDPRNAIPGGSLRLTEEAW